MERLTEKERLERARRVQALREMTKLSRREFAKKTGIPNTTLQHWEDGKKHVLPEKSVRRFIKALLTLNVHCTYEWLMHGEGSIPHYVNHIVFREEPEIFETSDLSKQEEDKTIREELDLFLNKHKDAVHLLVPDDAMEPCFIEGELVAGICVYGKEKIERLVGLDCIVLIEGKGYFLRKLLKGSVDGYFHLGYNNPKTKCLKPFFYNVELVSAASVVWTRRKWQR